MKTLFYKTVSGEITLEIGESIRPHPSLYLYIKSEEELIAKFSIELVWDMLKENLRETEIDTHNNSGLQRRILEAESILI